MKKGFTLIELIVIMALFAIVATLGMSFLLASRNNFSRSQENSELYSQVRIVSDFIRDELRNAIEIELVDSNSTTFDAGYNYLYMELEGTKYRLKYINHNGIPSYKSMNSFDYLKDMFTINSAYNGSNTLDYTLKGSFDKIFGSKVYDVQTSIHLNNIVTKKGENNVLTNNCIKYKKP